MNRPDQAGETLASLRKLMRDEVNSYLELAVDYGNFGAWDEALGVLNRLIQAENKRASSNPLLYYYAAYASKKKGAAADAARFFKLASEMPPDYCFPFQLEMIDVLRAAMEHNPTDAMAPLYLGNLLFDLQPEAAIKEWEKAGALGSRVATVGRAMRQEPLLGTIAFRLELARVPEGKRDRLKDDESQVFTADIVYEGGTPKLANKKLVLDSRKWDRKCWSFETQDFIPPEEKGLTLAAYLIDGTTNTDVYSLDLETGKLTNLTNAPEWYDEPEGIFPDGKTFTRVIGSDGKTGMFDEGTGNYTRDPMVLKIGETYFCYYCANPDGAPELRAEHLQSR